jgi:formylglycine-generating enzyme required for sulfatase activity
VPQSKKTSTEPSQDANRDSQPDLQPWPPETVAFEGTKAAQEWSANGLQLKFCWCPAGTFMMGSPKEEKDRSFNGYYEEQTMVRLTKGFWLAKYETTQEQWERMMGTNLIQQLDMASAQSRWETRNPDAETWWDRNELKWRPQRRASTPGAPNFGEGSGFPMYYVNHLEATDFCQKLTEQERKAGRLPAGWEYRLPTEAQWEYACRAGTTTATAFGDQLSSSQANFDGNFPYNGAAKGPALDRTQPVGSYPPNGWGLCDMHGNAWEWCRDWEGKPPGGTDPEIKYGEMSRVVRSGGWRAPGKLCRSATRIGHSWWGQDFETGFRIAIVQLPAQPKPVPETRLNIEPLPPGILVNSIGMQLAQIPAGKFLMGSPVDEPYRAWLGRDEVDYEERHLVTISEPFYLGIYPVTQEQYERIMANTPGYQPSYFSSAGGGKDKVKEFKDTKPFPRETVSWEDVQEFCRRISDLPEEKRWGRRYRLPTEAEWEYACRAGTTTPYYCGNTITTRRANIDNRKGRTTPVGSYKPNAFGLYDMHGNVLEWCDDLYAPYQKELRNPKGGYPRVGRGGFWSQSGVTARSAFRQAGGTDRYTGFRVALSVGGWRPKPEELTPNPSPPPKAMPADPLPAEKVVSNPEVLVALGKLKSNDKAIRLAAAEQLSSLKPDANRLEVAKTLEGMLTDPDFFVQGTAVKALGVWGGPENLPRLIAMTTDKNIFNRGHAMSVLVAMKNEQGAEAIAQRLNDGMDRGGAGELLKQMGAVAEPAVIQRLKSGSKEVRIEACKILLEIGTDKCIAPLEEAAKDQDADVARQAKETLYEVKPSLGS